MKPCAQHHQERTISINSLHATYAYHHDHTYQSMFMSSTSSPSFASHLTLCYVLNVQGHRDLHYPDDAKTLSYSQLQHEASESNRFHSHKVCLQPTATLLTCLIKFQTIHFSAAFTPSRLSYHTWKLASYKSLLPVWLLTFPSLMSSLSRPSSFERQREASD